MKELPNVEPTISTKSLMSMLSTDMDISQIPINSDTLMDKTKLFLVAQANNELNRVIKMTNFLDKLEDNFVNAVEDRLDETPGNLTLITQAMEVVSKSLNRSNELITQILKDDKLSSIIINTTNIITPGGDNATIIDATTRDTVRNLAKSMLAQLQTVANTTTPDNVVDVPLENTTPINNISKESISDKLKELTDE